MTYTVLSANIRAFNSCEITQIIQFVFHSSYMNMYFMETMHKTNSTVFLPHLDTHMHSILVFYQHFTFSLLMSWEELKRKGIVGCPFFLFLLCHHFQ